MTETIRLTLGDRIAQRAPTTRPWQRSLASLVSEAFDDIEALPRTTEGYFANLAASIDDHLEQEFRYDMAQSRATAKIRLARNPHDESAKALLAWVEEQEASPPLKPVNIATLRETVYRERVKRKQAGTYERVVHGVRKFLTGGRASPSQPPEAPTSAQALAGARLDEVPTTAVATGAVPDTVARDQDASGAPQAARTAEPSDAEVPGADRKQVVSTPAAPTAEPPDIPGNGIEPEASGTGAVNRPAHELSKIVSPSAGSHACITDPSAPDEGVDAMYSQLNSGRGYDVERVGEARPVRPRKLR